MRIHTFSARSHQLSCRSICRPANYVSSLVLLDRWVQQHLFWSPQAKLLLSVPVIIIVVLVDFVVIIVVFNSTTLLHVQIDSLA